MIGEYSHEICTWKAYPQAHHYKKLFKDVHTRFKKVSSKWPQPPKITEDIQKRSCKIDNGIRLVVIGRENVDVNKFVVSAESLEDDHAGGPKVSLTEDQKYTIIVCYEKIKDLTDNSLQIILNNLSYLKPLGATVLGPLIVCEVDDNEKCGESKSKKFCENIKSLAHSNLGINICDENIVVDGTQCMQVSSRISEILERELMVGFYSLKSHLQDLIGDKYFDASLFDIIESDQLVNAMQGFLKNGLGFVDMLESNKDELPFIDILLTRFADVIRCAVMAPLASKYGLTQEDCNDLAHQFGFDDRIIKSVSKNARYHLSKMETPCTEMKIATKAGNEHYIFPAKNFVFISYIVREDIRNEFKNFEEVLNCIRRVAVSMKKILFEINGYLNSSKMIQGFLLPPRQSEIPAEVKEAVLRIEGVYGMGTIYGRLEIHLKKNADKTEIETQICEIMEQFKFRNQYNVSSIQQELRPLCLETGRSIGCECPTDNFKYQGTLGGLARDKSGEMYVLTCAHVVHAEHYINHDVFNENRRVFATSQPNVTIPPKNGTSIDIAAVKLIKEKDKNLCETNLKDEKGNASTTTLYEDTVQELIENNRRVYKHGAGSNFTEGIICSSNYCKADRDITDQLILIEALPGLDEVYATEGDSGSINCMFFRNHVSTVTAVSMLAEGDLRTNDDNFCTSFVLKDGIDRLNESGNLQLRFPVTD